MATKRTSRKSRSSRGGKKRTRHGNAGARTRDRFEVTVAGEGTVYSGGNRREALSHYAKWARADRDAHVTMYDNDMDSPTKVVKESEPMTTLYLTPAGYAKAEREVHALQDLVGRDVGFGDSNWINIMTQDPKRIARAVQFLGKKNVDEIA
jgi:hypothetical protein